MAKLVSPDRGSIPGLDFCRPAGIEQHRCHRPYHPIRLPYETDSRPDIYGGNLRRLTFHGDYNTSPAWSPKGSLIAYVSRQSDYSQQICVTDPSDFEPIQLTFSGNNEEPSWSPDGLHIAFISNRTYRYELWTMNWDGTRQRRLTRNLITFAPDWSPYIEDSEQEEESGE